MRRVASWSRSDRFVVRDNTLLGENGNPCPIERGIWYPRIKHPSVDIEHFSDSSGLGDIICSLVFVCPTCPPCSGMVTYTVFYQHRIRVESGLGRHGSVHSVERAAQSGVAAPSPTCRDHTSSYSTSQVAPKDGPWRSLVPCSGGRLPELRPYRSGAATADCC
ncbi:uncharacterized protein PHACADRAFT_259171 [Phanerochaete carnosa HHB-10118-sp]|uniref:Uncharacterized protein n=1 Tax=Phanerochaete carnosa (strain HHB-10118-sp) TaxID=650164 RepID=K5WRJ4_PHACS|nr:uncharacterized protein PHACADRAFT_259171 [Phanerochaete carnosa HHB-10118-sp]EKM53002.1 hypothetical protein PHACADRAFT_259171 [Phanerochaete carnosa HHB-10118-sp]